MKNLWYEYPIQANMDDQKRIIRQLRKWILNLESRGLIQGFAFNHYSHELPALNVRFDCTDDKLTTIRKELDQEVKKLLPSYVLQERLWDNGQSPEYVYKAYEFGSRCVFLFWDLIERGRFPEEFANSYLRWTSPTTFEFNPDIFNFQSCFGHGVMNSLSVSKIPNEQWLHLASLIESTKSSNPQELCAWIQSQPDLFFPKKQENQNEQSP
jgi:hypothetical protein